MTIPDTAPPATARDIHRRFTAIAPNPDPCAGNVAAQLARNLAVTALRYTARQDVSPEPLPLPEQDAMYGSFAAVMLSTALAVADGRAARGTSRLVADAWRDGAGVREWLWEEAKALDIDPEEVTQLEEARLSLRGAQGNAGGTTDAGEDRTPGTADAIRSAALETFGGVIREEADKALVERLPAIEAAVRASERQRLAAVIPPERFRKLADWFDTDDEFKVTMFPETWPSRGSETQDDLRKFAALLEDGEAPDIGSFWVATDENGDLHLSGPCAETLGCLFGRAFSGEKTALAELARAASAHTGMAAGEAHAQLAVATGQAAEGPDNDGNPVIHSGAVAPGGWVCAVPVPGHPDDICGYPVESEPCPEHRGEDWRPE